MKTFLPLAHLSSHETATLYLCLLGLFIVPFLILVIIDREIKK